MDITNSKNVIYVLTNPMYAGYVKVGYASDLKSRLASLNTGMLKNFEAYAVYETEVKNADKQFHALIEDLAPIVRAKVVNGQKVQDKEFFKLEPEQAYDILKHVAVMTGTVERLRCKRDPQPPKPPEPPGIPKGNIPDGTYHLNRFKKAEGRNITAKASVKNGEWAILEGSMLAVKEGAGTSKLSRDMRAKAILNQDFTLREDLHLGTCSPSLAGVVVMNQAVDGWNEWKTQDGEKLNKFK